MSRQTPVGGVPRPALRFAVIGCGAIAQVTHLPILSRLRGARLVALCDNDAAKARALAQRFEVPSYFTDIDELLDWGEVDAVVVATPNHLHEVHVLSALRAGAHVLAERPLALTERGVVRILTSAARTDRKVLASNPHRFRADVQALAGILRNGELGKLVGVRAGSYHRRGSAQGWRLRRAEAGGGAFLEYGHSLLDLALWLTDFPEPQRVSAHFTRERGQSAVEDTMCVLLACAGDVAFTFNVTWNYVGVRDRWAFEVLSSRGSARLGPLRIVKEVNGRGRDVSPEGVATRDAPMMQARRAELAHFVAVARGDVRYEPPSSQATVMRIIEAAYTAAEQGHEVAL